MTKIIHFDQLWWTDIDKLSSNIFFLWTNTMTHERLIFYMHLKKKQIHYFGCIIAVVLSTLYSSIIPHMAVNVGNSLLGKMYYTNAGVLGYDVPCLVKISALKLMHISFCYTEYPVNSNERQSFPNDICMNGLNSFMHRFSPITTNKSYLSDYGASSGITK